jgi:two-component system response regulator
MAARTILQVEDNPGDVELLRLALAECGPEVMVHAMPNGVRAFTYLRRTEIDTRLPLPTMILLDLNMPIMGGLIFLRMLRAKEAWESVPVTVLTSSVDRADMIAAQSFGVLRYEVKPNTYEGYLALAQRLVSLPCMQGAGGVAAK